MVCLQGSMWGAKERSAHREAGLPTSCASWSLSHWWWIPRPFFAAETVRVCSDPDIVKWCPKEKVFRWLADNCNTKTDTMELWTEPRRPDSSTQLNVFSQGHTDFPHYLLLFCPSLFQKKIVLYPVIFYFLNDLFSILIVLVELSHFLIWGSIKRAEVFLTVFYMKYYFLCKKSTSFWEYQDYGSLETTFSKNTSSFFAASFKNIVLETVERRCDTSRHEFP